MNLNDITIKHVCFDLDGTLFDSYPTILKATIKTLEHLGLVSEFDELEFQKRIGHHFLDIFNDLKISVPDLDHFINIYKNYYFDYINESIMYDGVIETLEFINSKGLAISLLTTKGQDQADKIIDEFNLRKYFNFVMGRREGFGIKPSPDPLLYICSTLVIEPTETIMVGDSELDIRCAKAAGAVSCAAAYGYRTIDQLVQEEPDLIIKSIKELNDFIK